MESTTDDEARLAEIAAELAAAIDAALGPWVERSVRRVLDAWVDRTGEPIAPEILASAAEAGRRAREEIGPRVRELLLTDVDRQRTTPLAIIRGAVRYPTEVLRAAGIPPLVRDAVAERQFPDDDYDLVPASLGDVDPTLHELGIAWGAAKAFVFKARRRAEGRR
ncbi:MAG: hypothetical protein WHS89_04325 [Acidimicrobiales bacterium]|jgi:hypothetical protein